jgi:hypothetical protein
MDLRCAVSLPLRIAVRWMVILSSTGFSLCGLSCGPAAVHRLKPVLPDRAGPVLSLLAGKPAGTFRGVLVRNADKMFSGKRSAQEQSPDP